MPLSTDRRTPGEIGLHDLEAHLGETRGADL
jgi:hypothetical protein